MQSNQIYPEVLGMFYSPHDNWKISTSLNHLIVSTVQLSIKTDTSINI